jgi:UDP-N-acetylglucosamine acyltransferase
MIDPRAIVDPDSQIAEDVAIGPFSVIGAGVSIAAGTQVGSHVVIKGDTQIGCDNKIYQFTSIGEDPQDKKYAGEATRLKIGDRNQIREFSTIHRGTVQDAGLTRIGNDNLIMAYAHVAHDCQIGNHAIMANAASLGGHVYIGDWAILGGFSIVHQFCHIGAHSFAGMGSVVSKDIPPYVMVGGHPAKAHGINSEGLRRRGFTEVQIMQIKRAYKTIYRSNILLRDVAGQISTMAQQTPELAVMADFLADNERGIVR